MRGLNKKIFTVRLDRAKIGITYFLKGTHRLGDKPKSSENGESKSHVLDFRTLFQGLFAFQEDKSKRS